MAKGTSVWIIGPIKTKTKGLRYYVRWRHDGVIHCQVAGGDLENAKKMRNSIEGKLLNNSFGVNQIDMEKTIGKLYEEYMAWYKKNEESTYRIAKYNLWYFLERFKNKPVASFTIKDMKEFRTDIYTNRIGKKIWGHNGNHWRLRCIRTMLNYAVGDCITRDQVEEIFEEIKIGRQKRVARFYKDYEISDILTIGCAQKLIFADIVKFAIATLMREGEIVSVTREMIVDYKIKIYDNPDRDETKTQEPRVIPINPEIRYMVDRVKQGLIFPGWNEGMVQDHFEHAIALAKIIGRARFHDLRHTGISILLRMGWTPQQIMKISGHKSLSSFQIYSHIDTKDIEDKMSQVTYNFPSKTKLEVLA